MTAWAPATVSHDLAEWSTLSLTLRADTLDSGMFTPNSYAYATSKRYADLTAKLLCGCDGPEPCAVDNLSLIEAELAKRI